MDQDAQRRPRSINAVNRRLFLKGAALSLTGLTIFGVDSIAFAAKASDETLAALDAAQAEYEAAMAELSNIGTQLEEAQYRLAECQANLDATNQQISELQASIAQKQQELAAAQDLLADRIKASYTAGSVDMIEVLFSATNFEDFVSRLYYAGKASDADAEAIQNVKDIKAQLEADERALHDQRARQEQLLGEQQAYTDELSQTVAYYQDYTAGLSAEVSSLMAQAEAELQAAQQAEYEAYLAEQERQQQQTGGSDAAGDANGGNVPDWGGDTGGAGNHVPAAASIAWNYIGVPYVWGGTDPSGFDCSGLAQYCYAQAGYSIGRDTYAQAADISARGQMVYSMDELQPGDLVFPHSGHVGIYQGGGMMIHAPYPGTSVKYEAVYQFSFGGCPV